MDKTLQTFTVCYESGGLYDFQHLSRNTCVCVCVCVCVCMCVCGYCMNIACVGESELHCACMCSCARARVCVCVCACLKYTNSTFFISEQFSLFTVPVLIGKPTRNIYYEMKSPKPLPTFFVEQGLSPVSE